MKIVIINGPNLNLLGKREPGIYGSTPFEDFFDTLRKEYPAVELEYRQSNHEGTLIDWIQQYGFECDGILLNAGGYTHTSIALGDAIRAVTAPVIEVHISDIYQRESFRHVSMIKEACVKSIVGHGLDSYRRGIEAILHHDF
ncbi:MAG: 3-dehydroquinate dehydratase [Bacteroidales bacterium]|nr:3-dehydroquinate dehydratase [Bacteroidales bacterium]